MTTPTTTEYRRRPAPRVHSVLFTILLPFAALPALAAPLAADSADQTKDNLIASLGLLNNGDMIARTQARYEATEREIDALKVQLAQLKSGQKKQVNLAQARPVMETVIAHWDAVPRQERRSLFEAFATHIHLTKITRHTKTVTVHWRDGSTSSERSAHCSRGYFWEEDALQKLTWMFENNIAQVEILKAFPRYPWQALNARMRYHHGQGYGAVYTGEKKYNRTTKWADTEEAKAEMDLAIRDRLQPASSVASID